jgi:hypothetical protein
MRAPDESLRLIPAPRDVTRHEGTIDCSCGVRIAGPHESVARRILGPAMRTAVIEFTTDGRAVRLDLRSRDHASTHDAEDYRLGVGMDGTDRIVIDSGSTHGLRHALVTLAQLFICFGRALPRLDIRDRPAIALRGVMLDVSRDKVPTMEPLRGFIDTMESLKLNHLQLYTEHAFAYAGHEEVWRGASPITAGEIRELDAYGAERGVGLAANQNCLGHLPRWLKMPRYAPLAEIPPDSPRWTFETDDGRSFARSGPHSLCPTDPRSLALIEDLLGQLLPNFSSPLVNIGCDEAFDVGQGRSRGTVAERGRAGVYFDWLRAVDQIVRRHGKRSLFWADIAWRHPEFGHLIPDGAVPLIWGYEANSFERLSGAINALGRLSPWCCPGTSSWLSITGRTRTRHANLRAAARRAGESRGGFLCCDWGDRGHRQHWPIALHAIAHAAHEAWTGGDASRPFDGEAAALHCFGDRSGTLGAWLEALGEADADLSERVTLRNTNALFTELHRPLRELPTDPARAGTLAEWTEVRDRLGRLRSRLESFAASLPEALVREELEHTLRLAEHAADKAIVCRACMDGPGGLPRGPARIRLAADLAAITEDHRSLWVQRNRRGGLDDSASHYERVIDDYEHPESAA